MSSTEKYEAFYTETYEGDYGWVDDEDSALDDGLEEYPHVTLEDEDYAAAIPDDYDMDDQEAEDMFYPEVEWAFDEQGYDLD